MPRQLPWKVSGTPNAPPPKRRRTADSPASSAAQSPVPSDRSATWPVARLKSETPKPSSSKSRLSLTAKLERSPSTSPPPEPPVEEFMIEGIDHDDRYRMVEDEFLSTAGFFTRHLHAAEYQRLKALTSTRNAETIMAISRPVTGQMTNLVKKRRAAGDLAVSQRRGLKKAIRKGKGAHGRSDSDDEDVEDPWAGTSLQGLMDSPRKKAVPLSTITGTTASTRTTAGFHDSNHGSGSRIPRTVNKLELRPTASGKGHGRLNEQPGSDTEPDTESDGLDGQPTLSGKYRAKNHGNSLSGQSLTRPGALAIRQESYQLSRAAEAPRTEPTDIGIKTETTSNSIHDTPADDDGDGDDLDFMSRIRDRRAQQRRRRETSETEDKDKKGRGRSSLDAIPLF